MALDLPSYLLGKSKGGSGGTSDYSELTNKPSINGVTLNGNKTSADLGISADVHYIDVNDATHPFIFSEHELGVYFFPNDIDTLYFKGTSENTETSSKNYLRGTYLIYTKKYSNASNYDVIATTSYSRFYGSSGDYQARQSELKKRTDTNAGVAVSDVTTDKVYLAYVAPNTAQTISGVKTFSSLPKSSVAPTNNDEFANKKYVDDSIASAITDALGGNY